ncbi:MAG TPA: phosphate-starvation-inducible PsiE family protein [Burkholderiales bacterium]|nr:phosphate-starvation-inducible PsiE family protein [Burkholderiales bacterium]
MNSPQINSLRQKIKIEAMRAGNLLVESFHYIALFVIGAATAWAGFIAFVEIWARGRTNIEDILLLFIYLELGAMVGIYFKTHQMPVRFLIYVAITALTRMLIGDIQINHNPDESILFVAGGILLLAISVFIIRYGSVKYPTRQHEDDNR